MKCYDYEIPRNEALGYSEASTITNINSLLGNSLKFSKNKVMSYVTRYWGCFNNWYWIVFLFIRRCSRWFNIPTKVGKRGKKFIIYQHSWILATFHIIIIIQQKLPGKENTKKDTGLFDRQNIKGIGNNNTKYQNSTTRQDKKNCFSVGLRFQWFWRLIQKILY